MSVKYLPILFVAKNKDIFRFCKLESPNKCDMLDCSVESWYSNYPCEIKYDPNAGRYLIAKKDITKGDLVLLDYPYAWMVFENWKDKICRFCLGLIKSENPRGCKKCNQVFYCSHDCQLNDSTEHFLDECQILHQFHLPSNKNYPEELLNEFKLLIRVLSRKFAEQFHTNKLSDLKSWERQKDFSSYCKLISNPPEFSEDILKSFKYWIIDYTLNLKEYIQKGRATNLNCPTNEEELLNILCRNRRNSFAYGNGLFEEPQGYGIYLTASLFNHSCSPNVIIRTLPSDIATNQFGLNYSVQRTNEVGPLLAFTAAKDIKKGDILSVSYLDNGMTEAELLSDDDSESDMLLSSVFQRRKDLKMNYLFDCECLRCVKELKEIEESRNQLEKMTDSSNDGIADASPAAEAPSPTKEAVAPEPSPTILDEDFINNPTILTDKFYKLIGTTHSLLSSSGVLDFVVKGFAIQVGKDDKIYQTALIQVKGKQTPDNIPLVNLIAALEVQKGIKLDEKKM